MGRASVAAVFEARGRLRGKAATQLDALRELNELRGDLESRFGTYPGDPVKDARVERERQMEAVLLPATKA